MIEYTFIEATEVSSAIVIAKLEDGKILQIPCDPANSDYQAYLNKDKAEQSTPSVTNGD